MHDCACRARHAAGPMRHCCKDRETESRSIASAHLVAHDDGCKAMVSNMHVAEVALGFDGLPLPRLRALHDRPRKEIQTLLHGTALEVAARI